jgi:hypothetical protein
MPDSAELAEWKGAVSAKLEAISQRLDELGQRFEAALKTHVDTNKEVVTSLASRLNEVENSQSTINGKVAVIGAVAGTVVAIVVKVVAHHLG